MSKLSDVFDFEAFHTKDIFKKLKEDPERLLYGGFGTDPWSAKALNWATGSNYEPLVDQMGGAYGGHTFSMFDNKDGGVYKRAQDAGIDTKSGGRAQDAAHIVAGLYSGGYGMDKLGGLFGAGGNSGAVGGAESGMSGWQAGLKQATQLGRGQQQPQRQAYTPHRERVPLTTDASFMQASVTGTPQDEEMRRKLLAAALQRSV